MKHAVIVAGALFLSAGPARAQPSTPPPAKEEPADNPALPANLATAEEIYQRYLRHRLPTRATSLIDTAVDLAALYHALPAMWDLVKNDPYMRMAWSQLKLLYKPTVQWSVYAGGLAESTGYAGITAGASVDIVAPLCRYIGAEANTHGYYQGSAGLSYDTRGTVCLPWGPFSFELGLLRQRDLRVGLSSAPSLPNSRYDSDGFALRIRSYRWLAKTWEGLVTPTDVVFRSYSVPGDDSIPKSSNFQVDAAFFRYIRYGKGFLTADREIEAVSIEVVGQEDTQVANMSSTVMSISPVKFKGARLSEDLYLSGQVALVQGRIVDLNNNTEALEHLFFFGAGAEVNTGNPDWQGSLRYRRRLLPDSEFRLLSEDRFDAVGQVIRHDDASSLSFYGALTTQKAAPPGVDKLLRKPSYGAEAKYGRYLYGPFYLQLTTTAARSYYASIDGARLLTPEFEFRALASVMASATSW